MRRRPVLLVAVLLLPALALPVGAQPAPSSPDVGAVLNILPPGSRGNVTVPQALQVGPSRTASPTTPPNYADQLEMYDAINRLAPGELSEDRLPEFFKDAAIDLPADQAVSVETPRPGVTVSRDRFGVPFVVGQTAEDVAFGAGFAGTQDRMFLTDLLRHVGAARTAEFLGPAPGNIAMDVGQLRSAAYTREEAAAQIGRVIERYPDEGPDLLRRLDAFIEGINAAQRALCPGAFGLPVGAVTGGEATVGVGLGPSCPVEYAALGNPPSDYDRADVVYIASLVGGIFGKGGGGEVANARWLRQLENRFGAEQARAIFEDLRERNDPEAPTTAGIRFPYEGEPVDPTEPGAALPDLDGPRAPGTGADAGGSTLPVPLPLPLAGGASAPGYGVVEGPFGPIDLGFSRTGLSNALLVGAAASESGHPTVVFGPQTGYFAPQLLTEISLRGPGIAARGVSFAGTQLIVQLGHGVDYAWSATSASSDNVDVVAERLCDPDGGAATVESTSYLAGGRCTPFDSYVHTQTALPGPAGTGPPQRLRMQVLRTRHGIVQERTTVDGQPVALVTDRSTYGGELDSAVGFARVNDPGFVQDADGFARAFDAVDYTFNWFYSDDRDISYFASGLLPLRAPGVNTDLPRFGDEQFDWQGWLPFDRHPRQTNPPQGFLSSWNNKQAPGFSAADNQFGYGSVYRSLLLDRRVRELIGGERQVSRAGLVEVVQDAATADLRAEVLVPVLLRVLGDSGGGDATVADALRVLRAWAADPHRVDRDRTGGYDAHQAAIALFDEWWESAPVEGAARGERGALVRDVLGGVLGDLADDVPGRTDDHPRAGLGSAWNGVGAYGYVHKDLRSVLGEPVAGRYSRTYCGAGSLEQCRSDLRASLAAATQRVLARQQVASVDALTYDKAQDAIRSTPAGLVGVRPIDWQNRPTFQQVVSFSASRRTAPAAVADAVADPAAAPGAGAPAPARAAPVRRLADTGAPGLALLGAVLLGAAAGVGRRRLRPEACRRS